MYSVQQVLVQSCTGIFGNRLNYRFANKVNRTVLFEAVVVEECLFGCLGDFLGNFLPWNSLQLVEEVVSLRMLGSTSVLVLSPGMKVTIGVGISRNEIMLMS